MKNKLHILFINSWFPSRVLPYNGDFIQRHAEAVATEQTVTAIHVISDKNSKDLEIEENAIHGVRTIIAYPKFTKNTITRFFRFFKAYLQILKKTDAFDVIHLNKIYPAGLIALYLKWFRKKPYIISEHWHGYHKPYCDKISFTELFWTKIIAKNATFICPVSNHLGKAMQELGITNKNYKIIPNTIDTNLFKPLKNKNDLFTIVHISSMDTVKNIPKILKTIQELSLKKIDFKFYLIGNNAGDFEKLSKELNIPSKQIRFINQLTQQDLVPYLQRADVFILFSKIENSPCVILEAFACGIPVISTDVGGIREHFPDSFGTLIPKENTEALLQALEKYHSSFTSDSKEEMYSYIHKNFNKKKIAALFTKVYLSALKK